MSKFFLGRAEGERGGSAAVLIRIFCFVLIFFHGPSFISCKGHKYSPKKNTREHHYYQLLVKKKFSPTIQFVGDVLIPKQLIYLWRNTVGLIIFTVLIS